MTWPIFKNNRPVPSLWNQHYYIWVRSGRWACLIMWFCYQMIANPGNKRVCLHPASFERPVSDRPPRRPLCDCFEHAQNFTATMASMAMSERPMCHPWTTKATVRPPFCLQRRPVQFCGRTREAQRSQPLCKGGINERLTNLLIILTCYAH